jgi:ADP-heptose:LPS heptosyltransferase/glycosyltransferase involved in cell wall biosynthesis
MLKLLLRAPVLTASGYGVHSRQVLKALIASGEYDISVMACNWGNTSYILDQTPFFSKIKDLIVKYEMEKAQGNTQYDVSVQVTIPNEFEKMARVNIGITAGIEVDRVSPEWIKKINEKVDLVIVPSEHSKNTMLNVGYNTPEGALRVQKPLAVCAEGVDTKYYNTDPVPEGVRQFDLEADFNYLFVGLGLDKPLGEDRKNLGNLVKWFCERFKDDPNVGLVLKAGIVNGSLMDYEMLLHRIREIKKLVGCGQYPRVQVIHGRLSDAELAGLYKHPQVKALVSLTHGEGFGLPLLEAAACGLPVVVTAWSGHLDFLQIEGRKRFVPLDFELKEIPESCVWQGVMEKGSQWANPKEDDTKLKLKKLTLSYEKPREWAAELAKHVAEKFSETATGYVLYKSIEEFLQLHKQQNPRNEQEAISFLKKRFDGEGKKTLLYTMPMSAGDVYISTAIVSSLRKKFPDHKIFFATQEKYAPIIRDNPDIDVGMAYENWMQNVPLCEQVFDDVFTPNLSIQTTAANWVKRGKGRLLGNEMAHLCDVEFGEYRIALDPVEGLPAEYIVLNPGSGKGQWEARNYLHWQEVINNLRAMTGLPVVQVGLPEDPEYKDVVDFRGKTSYNQLATVVKGAKVLLSIDSVTSHLADGLDVPQVSLYGSSYATSTGPVNKKKLAVLLDTPDRYDCDRACYKYTCSVDKDHPCVNEIAPKKVVEETLRQIVMHSDSSVLLEKMSEYKEHRQTISGYTHVLNPSRQGYPWRESIQSMLGFCDQVVVVDGGSTDETLEKLKAWAAEDPRLEIAERPWDWEEPGMDGQQKAFGRAMCTGDFLWQQDCDEVVHEEDYEKIKNLVKRFPKEVNLIHLPVVELWGDSTHCRTDRHTWKWRLSRNDYRITHGIFKDARVVDEKTGKTFAKKGMSDGCEYIDMMDYTFVPHAGFYDKGMEMLRRSNPQAFGERMNEIYDELPSVYHYSWADIPRKIRNFRDFWDKCWSNLYNDPAPAPRFPEVKTDEDVLKKAAEMKEQGGEHQKAPVFALKHSNPAVMKNWINRMEV